MKHTPHSAALAARSIMARTSRIPQTVAEFWEWQHHIASLPPSRRADDPTWANAYQAYRLAKEQLGLNGQTPPEMQSALVAAVEEVLPELFAQHWEGQL